MGYLSSRFTRTPCEVFQCMICKDVLEYPRRCPDCDTKFCLSCIQEYIERAQECPFDRKPLNRSRLRPVDRQFNSQLNQLELFCRREECHEVVKLQDLFTHERRCEIVTTSCQKCGGMFTEDEFNETHQFMCTATSYYVPPTKDTSQHIKELEELKSDLQDRALKVDRSRMYFETMEETIRDLAAEAIGNLKKTADRDIERLEEQVSDLKSQIQKLEAKTERNERLIKYCKEDQHRISQNHDDLFREFDK